MAATIDGAVNADTLTAGEPAEITQTHSQAQQGRGPRQAGLSDQAYNHGKTDRASPTEAGARRERDRRMACVEQ